MAMIGLQINDPANRMTLKVMLEAENHTIVESDRGAPLLISDNPVWAVEQVATAEAVLLLTNADNLTTAVQAMRQGVFGYIFLPFQPGEAGLMIQRALARRPTGDPQLSSDNEGPIRTLEAVEASHILDTLRRCKNNQAKTARVLGIGRNTLWRKLKKIETMQKLTPPGSGAT